jgi:hypothetical protein
MLDKVQTYIIPNDYYNYAEDDTIEFRYQVKTEGYISFNSLNFK